MRNLTLALSALLGTACLAATALAQESPAPAEATAPPTASPALSARIAELPEILRGEGEYAAYFAPAFVAQVPQAAFAQASTQFGITPDTTPRVISVEPRDPNTAMLRVAIGERTARMAIAVDPQPPHQVSGLRILGFDAGEASVDAVQAAIRALPGSTSYAFARLGDGAPELLAGHHADEALAVGSSFKLWILAELVRATNAGERSWDDMVTLEDTAIAGGRYYESEPGTQVPLRELAEAMISVSDNSATDILLHHLGRERVETMMAETGVQHAARNRPMPSTLDLFKLKSVGGGALAERWAAADEAGRRALLDGEVAQTPVAAMDIAVFQTGKPVAIDRLEYFASANDLIRTMDWLRRNTQQNPVARAILGKNPGLLPGAAASWDYVGYKGGSETGVIAMTWLLERGGVWYALSASWNDTQAAVDDSRFSALMSRWAELAQPAR